MPFVRIAVILCVSLIAACTTPGNQPVAPSTISDAAKSGNIQDGKAHVYAFLGTLHGMFDFDERSPANFIVNGTPVGGINHGECLFLELSPGTYSFAWQERGPSPVIAAPMSFTLAPNQNLFVAFDINESGGMIAGSVLGGAVGGIAAASSGGLTGSVVDRSVGGLTAIQKMKIVVTTTATLATVR